MSFESEIKELRKKRIGEGVKTRKLTDIVKTDIAPLREKEDTSGLFKWGTLDDGFDSLGTALALGGTATLGDISAGILQGAGGLVEGVTDLGAYAVSGILHATGKHSAAWDVKNLAKEDTVAGFMNNLRDKSGIREYSFLGDLGYDVGTGAGYVLGLGASAGLGGAAGLTQKGMKALSAIVQGLSATGSGMGEAYRGGASAAESAIYGASSAAIEVVSEMMFGGFGSALNKLGVGVGVLDLDDLIAKGVTKNISNKFVKNLAQYGIKASGEGVEELVSGFLTSLVKKATYESEKGYGEILKDENLLKQAFSGFLVSAILQGGDFAQSVEKGTDFVSKLTDNDQKVFDAELKKRIAEEEKNNGKKLTTKDKNRIYDEVMEDLKEGGIDIDTIEEVLGGDTYKNYKNTVDSEDALKKELDSLRQMKKADMNDIQNERLEELKGMNLSDTSKRDSLKSQLGKEVYDLAKDGYLAESYNERARRGEKFTADLTKYKGKQAEIVQKAIDSGFLNNTRKTHALVDLIAKVGGDKDIDFDFTNNEKLKNSGFAVEGKIVNGYVTKDGITVNINSKKALNSVVGHEITHVLEGTELYNELRNAVYEYSKTKGDYDSRRANIEKLYEGIKDADMDAELTADLIGDYLFTDTDFVRSLSTKNRNLFEKLFDEIKYLCKMATAGSKEARQLEAVKKAFQEAYRESGKSTRDDTNSLKQVESGEKATEQPTEVNLSEKLSPEDAQAMNIMASNIVKAAKATGLSLDDYYKATENINAFNPTRADANAIADALAEYVEVMDNDVYRGYLDKIREFGGGGKYSLSSMANTFFDDPNMSAYEFQQADYKQTQGYKDYVEQCVNNYRQTRADFDEVAARKAIEDSIDGIVKVAIAAKKAGYDIYDDPSKRDKKDSKKRLLFSSLEPNSEYTTSNDISTICDKRQNFADIYDDIVRREEAMGVPKGKRFFDNVDNYFAIHKIMADKGLTQPCRQCYVESMRKNLAPMANAFLRLVQETNPNNTANDQLYHQKGKQKGEMKTSNASTRELVINALELHPEYGMTVNDLTVETLTTADGLAQLKIQAPLIYEAFNSFYGQSKPKMPKAATPFRFGELTALLTDEKGKIKQSLVDRINATGGFRLQSYSDFQIQNYTDVLQVLFEAGTLGLKGHAYTKVPAFLEATEGTNLKRNISIFMYKDGNEWKIDRNDSFPYSLEEIYDIVNADESGNTSIIAVSQNAEMSAWIMANDNVGYGIPFHKSGMKMGTVRDTIVKEGGREIKGYSGIKDHTKQQTEVWAKTTADHKAETKVKKGINIYEFWDFENKDNLSKNELIEKNVKRYINECEIRGYLPKFREYVMNNDKVLKDTLRYAKELGFASPDATIDDISFTYKGYRIPYGYYKFLGDFGMFTPDGQVSTPKVLSLENYDFDKAVKFFEDAESLRRNEILQQFSNGEERQKYRESNLSAEQLDKIVKQKRGEVVDEVINRKNSLSFEDKAPTRIRGGIYGEDVILKDAPMKETVVGETPNAPIRSDVETETVAPAAVNEPPIITTKQKIAAQVKASQTELEKNIQARKDSSDFYDKEIAHAQSLLDGKKNKNTKAAQALVRRIERLTRLKSSEDANFQKRINDIESRIERLNDKSLSNHDRADNLERYKKRENAKLEAEKGVLAEEFEERRANLQSEIGDKDSFISNRASELYNEISNLKKGVRASKELGYLLDHGYEWKSIKTALINAKHRPNQTVNVNSAAESVVREMLNEEYENKVYELDELDNEYNEAVAKLEAEARKKLEAFKVANQRSTKQQEYSALMENLVGDTSTWVDKKLGLQYKTNTLRRNLRDIVRDENGNKDIAKADAIYDELQGKYNHNEASLNRETNQIKKPYADMKFTKAEDAYIQMLGEFRHNPDTSLTKDVVEEFYNKHKDSIDVAKVDRAIDMARETYDSLLERVNEVLHEQGMKEIPYRKGYFPHFTEDKQNWLAKLLNWKTQNNEIPTDIAGLTEQFNPNRSWQSFNKQRMTDETDYSFSKGLDTYVQGSLDWIYHIEDIQKRRALENYIRYSHSEQGVKDKIDAIRKSTQYDADEMQEQIDLVYKNANNPLNNFVTDLRAGTNRLANKKSSLDRPVEEALNRKYYSTVTNLSNRVTANMVGGSISSALTNFIPITQSWGQVSPVSSLRAMGETIRSAFKNDGVVDKSTFLTNRLNTAENLYKTTWDKIGEKVSFLMDVVDNFTAQTVWRSKYLENINNGMSENAAIKDADQFAENVMAGRSRGNNPTIFDSKNPLIKTLTAFQLEVSNQYGYMLKDMPTDMRNETKAKLIKGYATMFIGAYVYNALYSSLTGRDAALDPIGIIEELLGDLFDDDEEETDAILNLVDNVVEEVPFVGGLMGGGRIPISSAMPYDGDLMKSLKGALDIFTLKDDGEATREWLKPVIYLGLPMGGGQIKKTLEGLSMFSDDHPIAGSYTDSGSLRFPVEDTIGNRIQAGIFGQWANKNAQTYLDKGYAPLDEKLVQEYKDVGMPINDYWEYRRGLNKYSTLAEKADYINSLNLTTEQKNILINNLSDRKEPIDMTNYGNYGSFDEFDFATKNPGKYTVSKAVGGYEAYKRYLSDLNNIKSDKDKYGNSITNSRKTKVVEYINGLDISYEEKIILYKSEYKSDDSFNYEIVNYLNSREDLSYNDIKSILTELGFHVDSKGNISWN